jgi:hypothetical protein
MNFPRHLNYFEEFAEAAITEDITLGKNNLVDISSLETVVLQTGGTLLARSGSNCDHRHVDFMPALRFSTKPIYSLGSELEPCKAGELCQWPARSSRVRLMLIRKVHGAGLQEV